MPRSLFLSDDVICLILTRLPAKEIIRLRCVCKRWLFLTSDPRFIKDHAIHNPHPTICGFFLCDHIHSTKYFPLNANSRGVPDPTLSFIPVLDGQTRISIETSCNGLVICSQVINHSLHKAVYHVCNPTTREFAELPAPREVDGCFSLAFDPSESPHYKVVSIGSARIHVYSSETRSWKSFLDRESPPEFKFRSYSRRSVYWNGALIRMCKTCLVSFDVKEESLKTLPMPPGVHGGSKGTYMGESGGKLQMIWRSRNEQNAAFYIWVMDSPHDSLWSLLCKVPILDLYPGETRRRPPICIIGQYGMFYDLRTLSPNYLGFSPVCFIRGGRGGDGMLLLNVPGKIVSYDVNDKVFTEICLLPSPYDCLYNWQKLYFLGQTLFSP